MIFLGNKVSLKYQKLIDGVFSQGDSRYFDADMEEVMTNFLTNSAIIIERKDVSAIESKTNEVSVSVVGLQKDLKILAKSLFNEMNITFIGFEKRTAFGIVDIVGKKGNRTIFVECGPCRIDKGFNYLRENHTELWVLSSYFDPDSIDMKKAELYIIKRGRNWQKMIEKYDKSIVQKLKKVKSPLDSL